MANNIFGRLGTPSRGSRSFYEELRNHDDDDLDLEADANHDVDDENLRQQLHDFDAAGLTAADSRMTVDSAPFGGLPHHTEFAKKHRVNRDAASRWATHDDEIDNDVPASLLVETNRQETANSGASPGARRPRLPPPPSATEPSARSQEQWATATSQQRLHREDDANHSLGVRPRSLISGTVAVSQKERALWRWVNTTNLDSFMRGVYNYYEGGGFWCILCSNALWLLQTLFVAVLLTFLFQCVDYSKVSQSKSLDQIMIPQCTRKMSGLWSFGIWLYSFFFIWKSIQYFLEIRRLMHIRDFFIFLLEIPEQDMQTISWQDVVARIMALRDQNPRTATNLSPNLRRFIGSQSKERLDAHDIANRLMRKDNYLIAMINKDVLNLSLPLPFMRGRQLFSKTMEWYLHYGILDMAFNELGQVQQDFLRADRRRVLSEKLKQRLYFAGILNLILAPVVLAYVVIVYFFTYYNEFQKDPKSAAARKYTSLAEWKFREFNELPHIFYERLHMSFPFATRYLDQFPKRMTEEIARSVAFMTGAILAVLALGTILYSELFLNFEITKDLTVLFYLSVLGTIFAITRGMVSEETTVFNPEYALRNVIEYTHYMPDHWKGRLHSFEVKQEFSELYKMRAVIFLEEVMGIITTPLLLLFSLPKCSDQIVDFFREFTIHVDGLGYVCSFAVFDFKKGIGAMKQPSTGHDVREDYYSTKHGKMAASYYGFIDNYVVNPKTGIPGHMPPGARQQPFHPPPSFPPLGSPTAAVDMQMSQAGHLETGRARSRAPGMAAPKTPRFGPAVPQPSPMASMLLDPHHQPIGGAAITRSLHRSRHPRGGYRGEGQIIEEGTEESSLGRRLAPEESIYETGGALEESMWETSPGKGLSRENSAANTEDADAGLLALGESITITDDDHDHDTASAVTAFPRKHQKPSFSTGFILRSDPLAPIILLPPTLNLHATYQPYTHVLLAVTLAALESKVFGGASAAETDMAKSTVEPIEEYDYESLPPNFSLLQNMMAGAFAGIAEHTVMYPVDAIKTRMQVLSPNATTAYTGVLRSTYQIASAEGVLSLWRGMSSVIVGAGPAHAVYFATYEAVKHAMGGNQAGVYHPLAAATSGAAATIASDAFMNPFDVIKQRMQIQHSSKMYRSMFDCAKYVYKNEGIAAFYVSYPTTLSMTVPFTALQFLAYESISTTMNPEKTYDPFTHCIAGAVAGGFAAGLTTPMDVIKTILQTRGTSSDPQVRNVNSFMGGCRLLYQREGLRGFFKGLRPRVLTTMPSTAICWSAYEFSKSYFINRNNAI
ncbi:hypothetical protein S40288_05606 [Stachybotrys chartarum IBT 40288]|nr:hypothetical protein S40288_05606 [Stachybotrys chartarum IBT 40288]